MAQHYADVSLGIDLDATSSTAKFQLGKVVQGTDSSGSYHAEYMYVLASGAIAQYAAVKITGAYVATELDSSSSETKNVRVGIAQTAIADTYYGWVVVSGNGTVKCISGGSAAANATMYTTTTDGVLDDVSTNSNKIVGLKLTAACATNTATFDAVCRMYID